MTDSPAPLPDSAPRWATEADNEALLELVRACPMKGSIEMLFDRSPDFFALSHLQGDGANICVVDDPASGKLAAVAAMAPFSAVYVDGAVRSADYACDLRVRPEWRGSGLYKQVYQHIEAWSLGRGEDLGFTTVMKGNRAMARIVAGRAGVVPYHHITTMRNFTVHFLFKKRPLPGITIRPATAADIPEMVALWSRLNSQKQFAPFLTVDSFQARLAASPGLAIGDYRLAHHDDRLVGSLALWNQESFKRMVVLKLNGGATWMRRWYNPIARLLGLARFPAPGNTMPYVYATQLCAETAHDLKALYTHVYNESIGPETFFISSMLDVRDPLITALDGFLKQTVDIEVYAMDPYRKWVGHPFNRLPVYFDPAIV